MASRGKVKSKKNVKRDKKGLDDGNWTRSKPVLGPIPTDSYAKTNVHGADHHGNAVPPRFSGGSTSQPVFPVKSSMELTEEQIDEVLPAQIEGKEPHGNAVPPSSLGGSTSEPMFPVKSSMELTEEQIDEVLPAQIKGKEPQRVEGIDPAMPESNNPGNSQAMSGGEGDSRGKATASEEGERDGPKLPTKRNSVETLHPSAKAEENSMGCKAGGKEGDRQGLTGDGGWGRGNGGGQYGSTRGRGRGQDEGRAGGRGQGQGRTGGRARADGHGGRAYGRGGRAYEREWPDRINGLGRRLVKILRHEAYKLGLNIRSDGYVAVEDLLKLKEKTMNGDSLCTYTVDDVKEAVRNDNKQRFGLVEESGGLLIRANQGHSVQAIDSEKLLERISSAESIPVCVHGTYKRVLDTICKTGLSCMTRRHIHFATGLPKDGGVISGMRGSCDTLIYLDVGKALKDEMKIYISQNGVILTEGFEGIVPSKYFAKIERWPSRELIDFQRK